MIDRDKPTRDDLMDEARAIDALGALAQRTRLAIVRHLVRQGREGASAGTVAEAVGAAPSRASFHLAALERAGLVVGERVSRRIVYRADFEQLGRLVAFLLEDCCANDPSVRRRCRP